MTDVAPIELEKPDVFTPGDRSGEHNSNEAVTDERLVYNYDLSQAPRGQKLLLLTIGHVAVLGQVTGNPHKDSDILGWYPLPVRDREAEYLLAQSLKASRLPGADGSTD